MRYRILGTTQALRADGTALPVGGARLRALLTVLALRPGRAVAPGLLVEEVWGAEPPADAHGALQALVGRLRRALGADAVVSAAGGYRLAAAPDDVDLHRFDRLTAEGVRALADGSPAKAADTLDDALALWQDPVLADLPDRAAEAARWETRHLDAQRARHTAALALGDAEQALPGLTALCDAHPLDEPLQVLRLRALRDSGRPAQALAAYEDVRRLLADRLGADPGPELRALHTELLRSDSGPVPAPGLPATTPGGPAHVPRSASHVSGNTSHVPRSASTLPGGASPGPGGAPRIPGGSPEDAPAPFADRSSAPGAPDAPGTPSPSAPATAVPATAFDGTRPVTFAPGGPVAGVQPATPVRQAAVPGNLRARLTSFVGREADIEAIRRDLAGARLVTLLGPGGAGKTRLSQEAAETVREGMRDGVWLAELAPVADPSTVPDAVLTAVRARETVIYGAGAEAMRAAPDRHDDPVERLAEHCGPRRMLLILDNCEHVVGAAARLAEELLSRCPQLTILATSREPLGVPGEVLRPVEPLPEPVALRLLADRGAAARPGFRVADDPEACAEICRRLDGLPLAIELAAARLRMLTPRQIADRLDDRFRLLTSGSRTGLPRQQTLRAVVDWSWDLLDEDEREVLRRLSVFAGGCDLAAAEAVCGPAALEALGSLVDKSLVVAAPSDDGEMRYRLLETVAEYAAERLDETGRRADAERAHLVHYRDLVRAADAELRGPRQTRAFARLDREYENIRAALRRAVDARDEQEALSIGVSLVWYWQLRDVRVEARTWCAEIVRLGPDPFAAPVRRARPVTLRCADVPPPLEGELLWEARRGIHLAHLACMDLEPGAWRTPEGQARLAAVADAYDASLPQVCRIPGMVWFFALMLSGRSEELPRHLQTAVETCRTTPGMEWELAGMLRVRADILAAHDGAAADAVRDADEALELFTAVGDTWGVAEALSARGAAREQAGRHEEAVADYRAAMAEAEQFGARGHKALLACRLAGALWELGADEESEAILRQVIEDEDAATHEARPAARLFLGLQLPHRGHTDEARALLRELRRDSDVAYFVVFDSMVLIAEAWAEAVDGVWDACLGFVRRALEQAADPLSDTVAPQVRPLTLTLAALVLASTDGGARAHDAARLLGAAGTLQSPQHVAGRMEREVTGRAVRAVRAALGDEPYETARAEGAALTFAEAAALV